jgi:hypothetical protein
VCILLATDTAIEKAYTAGTMLMGTILTAYMVSQLSVFLSQINASQREYRHKMDAVQARRSKDDSSTYYE